MMSYAFPPVSSHSSAPSLLPLSLHVVYQLLAHTKTKLCLAPSSSCPLLMLMGPAIFYPLAHLITGCTVQIIGEFISWAQGELLNLHPAGQYLVGPALSQHPFLTMSSHHPYLKSSQWSAMG